MPERCPFRQQVAAFRQVGQDFEMDCLYCLIEVRFEGADATMECKDPATTLGYVWYPAQRWVERPVLNLAHMEM